MSATTNALPHDTTSRRERAGTPPAGRDELLSEFAPLFDRIRAGAVLREQRRELPTAVVQELKERGFTALRVPTRFGGRGVSLESFFGLLVELAAADSNVAHLFRGHIAHVENLLLREPGDHRDAWLTRIGEGALIGNAASERQDLTEITTVLQEDDGILTVSGTKYYTTGSLYADWISLSAVRDGQRYSAMIRSDHPGVRVVDDWDGFGQQLTASGSLTVDHVPVERRDVTIFDRDNPNAGFGLAVFQTVLLAVAAGIAQAAVDDAIAFVKPRRRTFAHPGERVPREEDLVQTVIGETSGKASSARLIVAGLAAELGRHAAHAADGQDQGPATRNADGESVSSAERLALNVFKAQQTVLQLALGVATEVFEVGGASATSTGRRLDRHWRNARTIASHNPAKYRARSVGEHLLTGRLRLWGGSDDQTPGQRP